MEEAVSLFLTVEEQTLLESIFLDIARLPQRCQDALGCKVEHGFTEITDADGGREYWRVTIDLSPLILRATLPPTYVGPSWRLYVQAPGRWIDVTNDAGIWWRIVRRALPRLRAGIDICLREQKYQEEARYRAEKRRRLRDMVVAREVMMSYFNCAD